MSIGTLPRRSSMSGPCFRDNLWSERCGYLPNLCKCPMTGSFNGEGGSFWWLTEAAKRRFTSKIAKAEDISERTKGCNNGELAGCPK